jgi:hypothetical protein
VAVRTESNSPWLNVIHGHASVQPANPRRTKGSEQPENDKDSDLDQEGCAYDRGRKKRVTERHGSAHRFLRTPG